MTTTSRTIDRRVTAAGAAGTLTPGARAAVSTAVALLVLGPRSAPARVVAPDPRAARREPWLGAVSRRSAAARDRLVTERFAHRPGCRRGGRTATQDGRAAGDGGSRNPGRTRPDRLRGRSRAVRPVARAGSRERCGTTRERRSDGWIAAGRGRRLAGNRHAEDRRGDAMP